MKKDRIKRVERPFQGGNIMMVGRDGVAKILFAYISNECRYIALDKDNNTIAEFRGGVVDIEYFKNNE